ncbi:proton-conducting transporter transmembrane domain-containing protein [Bremerella sp. P1]|uniref:proton-conducting transporter transmembrane domain-containing protein n=1 Tax=Bremerella sp. P1 TaxID=3026424 RepID=UPI00236841D4|nr:proton-conducting transporter membrane subunit [Bremerella sp. P1]WDI41497.1 proton-conducting transporter membrane subunit [Bremerella sp. P1]
MLDAAVLLLVVPLCLVLAMVIPTSWANRHPLEIRRFAQVAVIAAGGFYFVGSLMLLQREIITGSISFSSASDLWMFAIFFDPLSAMMSLLIAYVAWIITRFSIKYLNGDSNEGRYYKWLLVCLGAILGLVVSGNLIQLFGFWILTSLALHQLLIHYSHRPWAIWTARKKFLISRLGDVFLATAIFLTYQIWGTVELKMLFSNVQATASLGMHDPRVTIVSVLFVLSALTKSAQFPFHTWLPDTLETPTPVSALMHAGIINAGGFLLIRLYPIVGQSGIALSLCLLIGGITCLLGGIIMTTQSSIKKKLAYSTMSQMGFMMMQCGVGAFSAAFVHIIFHSLYKSHAFLRSGSAVANHKGRDPEDQISLTENSWAIALGAAASFGVLAGTGWLLGIDVVKADGRVLLGLILALSLAQILAEVIRARSTKAVLLGVAVVMLMAAMYLLSHEAMHRLAFENTTGDLPVFSPAMWIVVGIVTLGFVGLAGFQIARVKYRNSSFVQAVYVHALNGFYLDIAARRVTGLLWGRSAPTP